MVPEDLIFSLYHPLLPGLIRVSFDLKAALHFIGRLEVEPALPIANGDDNEEEGGLANDTAVVVAAKVPPHTGDSGVNDENVALQNNRNIPQLLQGADSSSHSAHMLPVLMCSNVQTMGRGKYGSTTSSPKKRSHPLSDITNRGESQSPVQSQVGESNIDGRNMNQSIQSSAHGGSPSKSLKSSSQHHVCPKEGRHCLFHKKDIGLLPSISKSAKLKKLLDKHQVVAKSFASFKKNRIKCNTGKGHRRRRILLVDRNLDEMGVAVEAIKALPSHDLKGRKQWVDIYDWGLLGYVHKHGSCRDSKLECIRRYWVGTV